MRKLRPLSIPFGLFFLAFVVFFNIDMFSPSFVTVLPYIGYAVLTVGMVVSYVFNRSKFFFVFLLLILIQFAFVTTVHKEAFEPIYLVIAVLAPINVWIFSVFPERSIVSVSGVVRISLLLFQVLILVVAVDGGLDSVRAFFAVNPMPQMAIICFLVVFLYLTKSRGLNDYYRNSIIVVLLSLFFLFSFKNSIAVAAPIFLTVSGLVLVSSLVRESYSMAYLDELTGLPARRALREAMGNLRGKFVIAMADIDHFKKINDNFGHDTGDDVLRHVASILSRTANEGKVFRCGGEEFVILFPGKDKTQVKSQIEELRKAVEEKEFFLRGVNQKSGSSRGKGSTQGINVTISIGVSEKNDRNRTPEKVLKAADIALYSAKNEGRNRVVWA